MLTLHFHIGNPTYNGDVFKIFNRRLHDIRWYDNDGIIGDII